MPTFRLILLLAFTFACLRKVIFWREESSTTIAQSLSHVRLSIIHGSDDHGFKSLSLNLNIINLPANMVGGEFQGFVEGWTWTASLNQLNLTLNVSPIAFSTNYLVSWFTTWSCLFSKLFFGKFMFFIIPINLFTNIKFTSYIVGNFINKTIIFFRIYYIPSFPFRYHISQQMSCPYQGTS